MFALLATVAHAAERAPTPLRSLQAYHLWVGVDSGVASASDPSLPPAWTGALEHGARFATRSTVEASVAWWGTEEVRADTPAVRFRETLDLVLAVPRGARLGAALTAAVSDGPELDVVLAARARAGDARRGLEARLGPMLLASADGPLGGARAELEAGAALGPRARLALGIQAEVGVPAEPWLRTQGALGIRAWPGRQWELAGIVGGAVGSAAAPDGAWAWAQGAATWWPRPALGVGARVGGALDQGTASAWAMAGIQLRWDGQVASAAPDRHRFRIRTPAATEVAVMGSFTGWQRVPLRPSADGAWEVELALDPGPNTYVYVVDGVLVTPGDADRLEPDGYGGVNGVLLGPEVSAR